MDINKLHALLPDMAIFVCVVDQGGFSAAAKHLGITPSTVSKQISRLEKSLGITLLERTTRKQYLSDAGRLAYEGCRTIVDSAKQVASISDASQTEIKGCIRLATPKAFGKQVLEPLLFTFMQLHPNISLRVMVTDNFIDPINGEVDVIFRLTDTPIENLVSKKLGKVRTVLCASPAYLDAHKIPTHPQQLGRHQCIYLTESTRDNEWEFRKKGQCIKLKVEGRFAANHTEMRLNAVKQGFGIGIFPEFTVKQAIAEGDVIPLLQDWEVNGKYQGVINMQYIKTQLMAARMRAFVDFMSESFVVSS